VEITVIKSFIDKNTGEPYNAGTVYNSDDAQRIIELQDGGYLNPSKKVKQPKKTVEPEEVKEPKKKKVTEAVE
jgi:hypothetical protein